MKNFQIGFIAFRRNQQGIVLLDAVIAILIFSFGILGIVALQGSAVKLAGDAQYRTNAAMFADQVIAQMWGDWNASEATPGTTMAADFSSASNGTKYSAWAATLDCANKSPNCLPGVSTGGTAINAPTVTIVNGGAAGVNNNANSLVTVTVFWKGPNDTSPHNYVSITQISR